MIGKLNDSVYRSAKSILLVNEKQGEFFMELCNKFGKESMVKKCKIVPSSEITKYLVIKMLKSMGLSEYINTVLVNIEDQDGNGVYNINDFLKMNNNDILKMNGGKKFDVVLMNPPYDDGISKGTGKNLHVKFTNKCLDVSNKIVCVMPVKVIKNNGGKRELEESKRLYDKYLISVDEVDAKEFSGTTMANVAIYNFDTYKGNEKITINLLSQTELIKVDSITKDIFSNVAESQILDFLRCDEDYINWNYIGYEKNLNMGERFTLCKQLLDKIKRQKRYKNRNITTPVFLFSNAANGGMNGTFISNKVGNISKNENEFIQDLCNRNGTVTTILTFNSVKAAENCKDAMMRPLLRFACLKSQIDQNMKSRVYKYIPNINWEDPIVKTDEGLLEVCGCPKDKCKEYAEYCRKVIEEVDKKKK